MRERGRASIVVVAGVASLLVIGALFFLRGDNPTLAGAGFMDALAKQDPAGLARFSYMEGETEESIKKKWEQTYRYAARYYRFAWRITGSQQHDDQSAAVIMQFAKNLADPAAYETKYELPMVKRDGRWKVDVRRLPRDMFPGLPR